MTPASSGVSPRIVSKNELTIPAGTQHGTQFRMRGKGVKTARGEGDQYVEVQIVIPKKVSREEYKHYEKLRELESKESVFDKFKKAFKD